MARETITNELLTTSPTLAYTISTDFVGQVVRLDFSNLDTSPHTVSAWFVRAGETQGDEHLVMPAVTLQPGKSRFCLMQIHLQEGDEIYWAADAGAQVRAGGSVYEVEKNGHENIKAQFLSDSLTVLHTVTAGLQATLVALLLANQDATEHSVEIQYVPPGESAADEYKTLANQVIQPNQSEMLHLPNTFIAAGGEIQGMADVADVVVIAGAVLEEDLPNANSNGVVLHGTHAALASVTGMQQGAIYLFDGTDTPYTKGVYNAPDWSLLHKNYPCEPFVLGDYGWIAQGGATATASGGAVVMTSGGGFDSFNIAYLRILQKAAPTAPYTITALFTTHAISSTAARGALIWRQSSNGRITSLEYGLGSIGVRHWTANPGSTTSGGPQVTAPVSITTTHKTLEKWLRITNDTTDLVCEISVDGFTWVEVHREAVGSFLTPDQIGFGCNAGAANDNPSVTYVILSLKQS